MSRFIKLLKKKKRKEKYCILFHIYSCSSLYYITFWWEWVLILSVLGSALCFPQAAEGFCTQLPGAMFAEGVQKISQRAIDLPFSYEYLDPTDLGFSDASQDGQANGINNLQTLELFPLHPTGSLEERSTGMSSPSSDITSNPSFYSETSAIEDVV